MFPDIINLKKNVYTLKVRGGYFFLGGYGLAEKTIDLRIWFLCNNHISEALHLTDNLGNKSIEKEPNRSLN